LEVGGKTQKIGEEEAAEGQKRIRRKENTKDSHSGVASSQGNTGYVYKNHITITVGEREKAEKERGRPSRSRAAEKNREEKKRGNL